MSTRYVSLRSAQDGSVEAWSSPEVHAGPAIFLLDASPDVTSGMSRIELGELEGVWIGVLPPGSVSPAVGALLSSCDFLVAAPTSSIELGTGVSADATRSQLARRSAPWMREAIESVEGSIAADLLLAAGLVRELVAEPRLLAEQIREVLATRAQAALIETIEISSRLEDSLDEIFLSEATTQTVLMNSEEHQQAIVGFLQKSKSKN